MTSLRTYTFPHIAAGVRQSDTLSLYLDGELQAQKTIGAQRVNTLTVNIGLEDATEAVIEDVQLFDYALFPEDIAELNTKKSPLEGGQGGVLPGSAGVSPPKEESLTPLSDDGPTFGLLGSGPVVTTTITYYYLNGQRIAQSKDGVFTWIHADHLSSATRITDVNGLEVRRLAYRSFGEEAENQGSGDDPKYKYTGKEHDTTGLYYFGARYYDPTLSRFISADTVYDAGPQGLNRYSYALNNPIIYHDPTGHQVEHWYQTVWVKPIETVQSTVNAGLVWVEEASGHHPYVIANTVPVKTISDTNFGALKSGLGMVTLGEEIGEWGADRKNPNKIPVVGRIGEDLGTSIGEFIVDPSVETGARVVAATAAAVGTALGGVQLARMLGVPGTQGTKRPVHKVSRSQRPNHSKMLENAQKKGHSLKGLKRGQGTEAAKRNRYLAQKEIRKQQGPPPDGYDYDEFPYASTEQGGTGAHVEAVPSAENQAAGRDLGKFYREEDVGYGDEFDIEITE